MISSSSASAGPLDVVDGVERRGEEGSVLGHGGGAQS
jgi:hypothetical protein